MKSLFKNWREFTDNKPNRIDERGYGFLQKAGSLVGLTKDFNYDAPDNPYGGFNKLGRPFIIVQFPEPAHDIWGDYLVRYIDGTEETISGKEIRTEKDNVNEPGQDETPEVSRDIGSRVKKKMEQQP